MNTCNVLGIPFIPIFVPNISKELAFSIVLAFAYLILALILGLILKKHFVKRWKFSPFVFTIVPFVASTLLLFRYGFEMTIIKGLVFFMLLLYASICDIKTKRVRDFVSLMIIITALIDVEIGNLPMMILSIICITIPQLIVAIFRPNRYGGADIKIMASCAFLLGLEKGIFAVILGLSVGIITTIIINKIKHNNLKHPFAVVPYLSFGCFVAYLI